MTADALAALKPRARRQLPEDRAIRSVYSCSFKGRDGVIVLASGGVFVAASNGWFTNSAPLHVAWLKPLDGAACDLQLWGEHLKVDFESASDAQAAVSAIGQLTDSARAGQSQQPISLAPDERLVRRCTYLGGANVAVPVKAEVDLLFGSTDIRVHQSPVLRDSEAIACLPYASQFAVELSGPGRFKTGGGFVGGGFGLVGATEGMAIAGLLNALTTRTQVISVIAVLSADYEGFFLCREHAPDELRRFLAPVFLRARQLQPAAGEPEPQPTSVVPDLVETLERLARLHQTGALTDEEFQRAKIQALGGGQ